MGDTWHSDEVLVKLREHLHSLWRAVDPDGDMIELLSRRGGMLRISSGSVVTSSGRLTTVPSAECNVVTCASCSSAEAVAEWGKRVAFVNLTPPVWNSLFRLLDPHPAAILSVIWHLSHPFAAI